MKVEFVHIILNLNNHLNKNLAIVNKTTTIAHMTPKKDRHHPKQPPVLLNSSLT